MTSSGATIPIRTFPPRISTTVMRMLSPITISSPIFLDRTNIQTSLAHGLVGNARPGLLQQAVPRHIGLWKMREDDQRERLLVPGKTGNMIQVNQEASGERGTE